MLYCDITTSFCNCISGSKLSGILRTELMLARELNLLYPAVCFIALKDDCFYLLDKESLKHILGSGDIDDAFAKTKNLLLKNLFKEEAKNVFENDRRRQISEGFWLLCSALPGLSQKAFVHFGQYIEKKTTGLHFFRNDTPFSENDVVFSAGSGGHGVFIDRELIKEKKRKGFHWCQVIYDMTTVLLPQVHEKNTIIHQEHYFQYAFSISDIVFYGGKTCMEDSERYMQGKGFPKHIAIPIKLGDNIAKPEHTCDDDGSVLHELGVYGPYILTVGTIEARKNHETLYKAYLLLLSSTNGIPPQLVIAGRPGWKTEEFLDTLSRDERVRGKIIILSPSDVQLDVLYRNCLFTVLASQYEGWSLTLPESYGYGKFCLTADVQPLREISQDLAEYIHPFDTVKWANRIMYYASHNNELKSWEAKIASKWKSTTWHDCAACIIRNIRKHYPFETPD